MIICTHPESLVGTDMSDDNLQRAAHIFADMLKEGAIKENIDTLFNGIYRSGSSEAVLLIPTWH